MTNNFFNLQNIGFGATICLGTLLLLSQSDTKDRDSASRMEQGIHSGKVEIVPQAGII